MATLTFKTLVEAASARTLAEEVVKVLYLFAGYTLTAEGYVVYAPGKQAMERWADPAPATRDDGTFGYADAAAHLLARADALLGTRKVPSLTVINAARIAGQPISSELKSKITAAGVGTEVKAMLATLLAPPAGAVLVEDTPAVVVDDGAVVIAKGGA